MNDPLRRLLLLPALLALLAVSALAVLNPRPVVALRLLVWTSPALPLGSWLAIACGGGGLLSAAAAAAALQRPVSLRRQVRRSADEGQSPQSSPQQSPQGRPARHNAVATATPQRPPGAPAPTVEVPFRVIRRGRQPSSQAPVPDPAGGAAAWADAGTPTHPVASAVGDGWDAPPSDAW